MKCYLGIDIGSISTKGVIIDEKNNRNTKNELNQIIVMIKIVINGKTNTKYSNR